MKNNNHPLQFEYCECGCKCYVGVSKGLDYTIYWNLSKKNGYRLMRGGRTGAPIGIYDTFEQSVRAAQDHWDKQP